MYLCNAGRDHDRSTQIHIKVSLVIDSVPECGSAVLVDSGIYTPEAEYNIITWKGHLGGHLCEDSEQYLQPCGALHIRCEFYYREVHR